MTLDATESDNSEVLLPELTSSEEVKNKELDESPAESSPASEETHEKKSNGVQERINKVTKRAYTAERERDELAKKLAEVETAKPQAATSELLAPALPDDVYDVDAMAKYHADNIKYQAELSKLNVQSVLESERRSDNERQVKNRQDKVINTYVDNAIKDGVDVEKLPAIENALIQAGINPQLGEYLMLEPNGAKIAEYLADNPVTMHELLNLDPVSAGIKIVSEIKPKALSSTPKVSNAPDPIPDLGGGGVAVKDEFSRTYPGAKFI